MNKTYTPKMIYIESTSRCNLRCKLCPINTAPGSGQHMDFGLYQSIIRRIAEEPALRGVPIAPFLNGEPFMNPRFPEMVHLLEENHLRYYFTTNGHFWNDPVFQMATEENSSCYQILFSLDGLLSSRSRSVEIARPGSDRQKVRNHIEDFISLKRWKKAPLDVALKICRRGQDWEEIEEYIAYWLSNGADYVCVGDALEATNETSMRIYPCKYPIDSHMFIRANGDLVRCTYNDEAVNDSQYIMGSAKNETPILELYNGPAYQDLREQQRLGIFPHPCDTCGFAYTGVGFQGTISFRNRDLQIPFGERPIFWSRDFYNSFFSLKKKWKDPEVYRRPD